MKDYRVAFQGIVANLFFSEKRSAEFVIFCYGLPSYPPSSSLELIKQFTEHSINVVCPEYLGTFSSSGVCTINNCIDTIHQTISFLRYGQGLDQFSKKQVRWDCQSITIFGVSFGGSIALVAGAKSDAVKKIVAVSAPTNYRNHNKKFPEEDLHNLTTCLKQVYQHTWRITPSGWSTLLNGSCNINPVDYASELKTKSVLLIHAIGDPIVNYNRPKELHALLQDGPENHQLELVDSNIHLSFADLDLELISKILAWIQGDNKAFKSN